MRVERSKVGEKRVSELLRGAVGTLMTGSYFTAAAALAGLALLLTHSPGYLESQE